MTSGEEQAAGMEGCTGELQDLIILGSGPAGLTAALYAGRARIDTLILGGQPGGSPVRYERIDNIPGFPGGVPGAQLMLGLVQQVDDLGVRRVVEDAVRVCSAGDGFLVTTEDGRQRRARALILATGAEPIPLGVPGEEDLVGRGVFYCAHCDAPVFRHLACGQAVVVGGGNTAVHTALYLTGYADEVTIVHRGDSLSADPREVERALSHPNIRTLFGVEPAGFDQAEGRLAALILRSIDSGRERRLPTQGVFVGIGQKPSSGLVQRLVELDGKGFVRVDGRMATTRPGIYAAGDVVDKPLRQILTAMGDGAVAADSAIKFIATRAWAGPR